jgi:hypothetical protein
MNICAGWMHFTHALPEGDVWEVEPLYFLAIAPATLISRAFKCRRICLLSLLPLPLFRCF